MVEKEDKHPYRTLAVFLAAGTGIFLLGLFLLIAALTWYAHFKLDPSVDYFYLLIGGAGALFGFERWLYYESGGVNPFHDA